MAETQKNVLSVNAKTKQATQRDVDKHHMTLQREEQRKAEFLALAEAFGTWMSELGLGRELRGADGFFDDVQEDGGVVLVKLLARLGIPVERPWDPPRNAFQAKENMAKFANACKKAGFKCVPGVDASPATLVPTLLEAAAVAVAQNAVAQREMAREASAGGGGGEADVAPSRDAASNASASASTSGATGDADSGAGHRRRHTIVDLPDALIKRAEDASQPFAGSQVVAAAAAGALRAQEDGALVFSGAPGAVAAVAPAPEPTPTPTPIAVAPVPAPVAVPAPTAPQTETETETQMQPQPRPRVASAVPKPAAAAAAAAEAAPAAPVAARPRRATNEIPQEEKDRMVNLFLMGVVALILFYLLFLR